MMQENHKLYMNTAQIREYLGCSRDLVDALRKGIQDEITTGRYSPYAISGRYIHMGVLIDYMKYRDSLEQKNLRGYVPKFNINEATQYATGGIYENV